MTLDADALGRIAKRAGLAGADFHAEIGSTNDRAMGLAVGGRPLPWLVFAERQTAGRGRGSNRWWSGEGALTFSLITPFDASVAPSPPARLSLVAGMAICGTLRQFAPRSEARLKWPNDVFLDGRKACGILVEVPPPPAAGLIVGVGINVNNSLQGAPAELRQAAISLSDAAGRELDRAAVLEAAVVNLQWEFQRLAQSPDDLRERWAAQCHLTGRIVHLESQAGRTVGLCLGIDSDGALLLQNETGPTRHLSGVIRQID
jgi:BirA family biotin operon repressor/biotin-[acetyl-CoA-carboxylase] ligase